MALRDSSPLGAACWSAGPRKLPFDNPTNVVKPEHRQLAALGEKVGDHRHALGGKRQDLTPSSLTLGQAIHVIATPAVADGEQGVPVDFAVLAPALLAQCRVHMPAYMVPANIEFVAGPLPRNPNGKIDRKLLASEWVARGVA